MLVRRVLRAAVEEDASSGEYPPTRVTGRAQRSGDSLLLSATVLGSADLPGRTESLGGPIDSLIPLAQAFAARVVAAARPQRSAPATGEPWFNPHRADALRSFVEAEDAFLDGHFEIAATRLRATVSLDPRFTAAWYQLAVATDWAGSGEYLQATDSAVAQLRRSARATASHRELAEGLHAYLRGKSAIARDRFLSFTLRHPRDPVGWYWLGETDFHFGPDLGRPMGDARAAFERAVALDPGHAEAILHLARLSALVHDLARVSRLAASYEQLRPNSDRVPLMQLLAAWANGDSAGFARLGSRLATQSWPASNAVINDFATSTLDMAWSERLAAYQRDARREIPSFVRSVVLHVSLIVAGSNWPRAALLLDTLGTWSPTTSRLLRAGLLAAMPAGTRPRAELDSAYRELSATRDWPSDVASRLYGAGMAPVLLRPYLAMILAAEIGDRDGVRRSRGELESARVPPGGESSAAAMRADARLLVALSTESGGVDRALVAGVESPDVIWGAPVFLSAWSRLHVAQAHERLGLTAAALRDYESINTSDATSMPMFGRALEARERLLRQLGRADDSDAVGRKRTELASVRLGVLTRP